MSEGIVTILSNAWFIVPAWEAAVYKKKWTRFCVYLCIIASSSMYHTCNVFGNNCALNPDILRKMDFFFAQLLIPMTALYIIYFPEEWAFLERIFIVALAFGIFIVEQLLGEALSVQLVLSVISLLFIIVYWSGYAIVEWRQKGRPSLPHYKWGWLGMCIVYTGVACVLFVTQLQYHRLYWLIHACWHTAAAYGQYYLLLACPTDPTARYKSLDAQMRFQKRRLAQKRINRRINLV